MIFTPCACPTTKPLDPPPSTQERLSLIVTALNYYICCLFTIDALTSDARTFLSVVIIVSNTATIIYFVRVLIVEVYNYALSEIDIDGDGRITRREIAHYLKHTLGWMAPVYGWLAKILIGSRVDKEATDNAVHPDDERDLDLDLDLSREGTVKDLGCDVGGGSSRWLLLQDEDGHAVNKVQDSALDDNSDRQPPPIRADPDLDPAGTTDPDRGDNNESSDSQNGPRGPVAEGRQHSRSSSSLQQRTSLRLRHGGPLTPTTGGDWDRTSLGERICPGSQASPNLPSSPSGV